MHVLRIIVSIVDIDAKIAQGAKRRIRNHVHKNLASPFKCVREIFI